MESVGYLASYAELASGKGSTCGEEAALFMADLKPHVSKALKAIMEEKPENPIRFLAEHLQKNNPATKKMAHILTVDKDGVDKVQITRIKKRDGPCARVDANGQHDFPLIGLHAPSIEEIKASIKSISHRSLGKDPLVHVIVQRDPKYDYFFMEDELYFSNYKQLRVMHEVKTNLEGTVVAPPTPAQPPQEVRGLKFDLGTAEEKPKPTDPDAILASKASSELKKPTATVGDSLKFEDVDGVTVKVSFIDSVATTLPFSVYDQVNAIIGLSDSTPLSAVVLASFAEDLQSMKVLLTAVATAMFPMKELVDLRQAVTIAGMQNEEARRPSQATQKYWQHVRQRRERRDKLREEKDELRRTTTLSDTAHSQDGSSSTPLVPQPPGAAAAAQEERKRIIAKRAARRLQEDVEFVHVLSKHRHEKACRIQAMMRGFLQRRKAQPGAFFEATAAPTYVKPGTGANIAATSQLNEGAQHKDSYSGPVLVRRTLYALAENHPDLFTTKHPTPPTPPRKKRIWVPKRTRIPPVNDDDISSEEETWEAHEVEISFRPPTSRPAKFNASLRLTKCLDISNDDSLSFATGIEKNFQSVSSLQHKAYDALRQHVVSLLHIAHTEMVHRGVVAEPNFEKYVNESFWELPSWFSTPHLFSQTIAQEGSPVPMVFGPLRALDNRVLYGCEPPSELPWGAITAEFPTAGTSPDATACWLHSPQQSGVFVVSEAMDVGMWRNVAMYLADTLEHDHMGWISTMEDPHVFVKEKPYVAVERVANQQLPDVRVGIQCTTNLTEIKSNKPAPPKDNATKNDAKTILSSGTRQRGSSFGVTSNASPQTVSIDLSIPMTVSLKTSSTDSPSNKDRRIIKNWFGVSWQEMERRLKKEIVFRIESTEGKHHYYGPPLAGCYYMAMKQFPSLIRHEVTLWQPLKEVSRSSSRSTQGVDPAELSGAAGRSSMASGTMAPGKSMRRMKSVVGRTNTLKSQASSSYEQSPDTNMLTQRDSVHSQRSGASGTAQQAADLLQEDKPVQRDPNVLVQTPTYIAEKEIFPHLGGSYSAHYHRQPMLSVAGQPWLNAVDRFIATVFDELKQKDADKPCLVVAVSKKEDMFYAVVAALVSYIAVQQVDTLDVQLEARHAEEERTVSASAVGSISASTPQPGGLSMTVGGKEVSVHMQEVESTVGDSELSNSEHESFTQTAAPPRDILGCLADFKFGCPAVNLGRAMEEVDVCLDLCGASQTLKCDPMQHIIDAELAVDDPVKVRKHVMAAVTGLERLAWLTLLAAFLRHNREANGGDPLNDLQSFAHWCFSTAAPATQWIERIDPWSTFPAFSPDPNHQVYSNQFDRWRNRQAFIPAMI